MACIQIDLPSYIFTYVTVANYYAFCYLLPIYIHYTTILTYCTDIRAASTDCKSEALPTELCGPLSIALLKDVYELNNVSNDKILMIIS